MNKFLMLTAAAVFGSHVSVALAGVHSFGLATASGGNYCDYGTVYTGVDGGAYRGHIWAWQHTNVSCSGVDTNGQGILGKTPLGVVADMSDNWFAILYGASSFAVNYVLPKKIKNGQPWSNWVELSGTTSFEANSGILICVDDPNCQAALRHHSTKSTLYAVKELIGAHRKIKAS